MFEIFSSASLILLILIDLSLISGKFTSLTGNKPFFRCPSINFIYLFIPVLVVGYITLERNWRKKERRFWIEREEERQTYVDQIFKAQEDERKTYC
jgi:hypothetical protein